MSSQLLRFNVYVGDMNVTIVRARLIEYCSKIQF